METTGKRVVVGLSGGVDSSVAAYLLKEQGYDVIGLFMKNWHDESVTLSNECPWLEDSTDALLVAQTLGIPYKTIDLSADYKQKVVDYMFAEYEKGRTPNPDVLCNREIKFDVFLDAALKLGADFVATGHYCQKNELEDGSFQLIAGADKNKDQSYFLCQLNQAQLAKALFPIGHLEKPEVRRIAEEQGLATANKKDSQGICFVGKVSLPTFLQQKLAPKKGQVIEIPRNSPFFHDQESEGLAEMSQCYPFAEAEGIVKGEHNGAHFYTVGQRKGLGIGGTIEPLFIIGTDIAKNEVYVGEGDTHPGLFRMALELETPIHWVRPLEVDLEKGLDVKTRIRYRQALVDATLISENGTTYLKFAEPMRSIAPGQFAAWYINNELIGSGVIMG
mgnify:CR=1 FL=1